MSTTSNILETRLYKALRRVVDYGFLGMIWLAACIPIVTACAATAALFGVLRSWDNHDEPCLPRLFWRQFRENFRQSLVFEAMWGVIGAGFAANLLASSALPATAAWPVRTAGALVVLFCLCVSVYIFPMMVSYRMTLPAMLRSATLFALGRPLTNLLALAVLTMAVGIGYMFPPAILVVAPALASSLYRLGTRVFTTVGMQPAVAAEQHDRTEALASA